MIKLAANISRYLRNFVSSVLYADVQIKSPPIVKLDTYLN